MPRVEVFDPPMCCSTGVCGPVVDPVLPRFAGDLDRLGRAGVPVARYNLAQEPKAFTERATVLLALKEGGADTLPIVLVDGRIVSRGRYPSLEELAGWAGLATVPADDAPPAASLLPSLSVGAPDTGTGCCG